MKQFYKVLLGNLALMLLVLGSWQAQAQVQVNTVGDQWTWIAGSDQENELPNYGTRGVPASTNTPGSRTEYAYTTDANGNFYIYGGWAFDPVQGQNRLYNDLWRWDGTNWTWLGGENFPNSLGNYTGAPRMPRSRRLSALWLDANGDFWIFGGTIFSGNSLGESLDDLWRFNVNSNTWTLISAGAVSNGTIVTNQLGSYTANSYQPPSSFGMAYWTDSNGDLFMFGGNAWTTNADFPNPNFTEMNGTSNLLWKYTIQSGQWMLLKGDPIRGPEEVLVTGLGVADPQNTPSGTNNFMWTKDANGDVWVFGGSRVRISNGNKVFPSTNHLWKWNGTDWAKIRDEITLLGGFPQGVADQSYYPNVRQAGFMTLDRNGDLTVIGGIGAPNSSSFQGNGRLNEVWKYNTANDTWMFDSGSSTFNNSSSFGTLNVQNASNEPSGRSAFGGYRNIDGDVVLFGGNSFSGRSSDFWLLSPGSSGFTLSLPNREWAWINGDKNIVQFTAGMLPRYGTRGVASPQNHPGSREGYAYTSDGQGNFYIFGGRNGQQSFYGDLWRWDGENWTWMAGSDQLNYVSTSSEPHALGQAMLWYHNDKLYVFGGIGRFNTQVIGGLGENNTMYAYDLTTDSWSIEQGNGTVSAGGYPAAIGQTFSQPPARLGSAYWKDNNGNLLFFGGRNNSFQSFNDVWSYNPSSNTFTWLNGSNTMSAFASYTAAGDINNTPGARSEAAFIRDEATGGLWLFSGAGTANTNDLWYWDPTSDTWDRKILGNLVGTGNVGPQGNLSSTNLPSRRSRAFAFALDNQGFYVMGGDALLPNNNSTGILNDLWYYDKASNNWVWLDGEYANSEDGIYGTQGTTNNLNFPGSRLNFGGYTFDGNVWIFGGFGYDETTSTAQFLSFRTLADLWVLGTPPALPTLSLQAREYTWINGDNTGLQPVNYGVRGVPSSTNHPGWRNRFAHAYDDNGNFYLFGGGNSNGLNNDLWRWDGTKWTWLSGSDMADQLGSNGAPGATQGAAMWVDDQGDIYIFGGSGFGVNGINGFVNTVWKYTVSTDTWAILKGDGNVSANNFPSAYGVFDPNALPAGRIIQNYWKAPNGDFYFFGGRTQVGLVPNFYHDTWKYSPSQNAFMLVAGNDNLNIPEQPSQQAFGGAHPGARRGAALIVDANGDAFLFGGLGFNGSNLFPKNDVWKFEEANQSWVRLKTDQAPTYGDLNVVRSTNAPTSREGSIMLPGENAGEFYLFGGLGEYRSNPGNFGELADWWYFDGFNFTWVEGPQDGPHASIYGTRGVTNPANRLGGRRDAATFMDANGDFYIYGGEGFATTTTSELVSDMWKIGTVLPTCVPQVQLDALIALYNALDGDNWTWNDPNHAWKDGNGNFRIADVGSWEGVTLDGNCNVTTLVLNDRNLTGVLPAELGDLTLLTTLNLQFNKLSGEIPTEIGDLVNLESLDLSKNALLGEVPVSLTSLSALTSLDLSYNGLLVWDGGLQNVSQVINGNPTGQFAAPWFGTSGVFFDVENVGNQDISLDKFTLDFGNQGNNLVEIYVTNQSNTAAGNESNPSAWTLVYSETIATGAGTVIDISGIEIPVGQSKGVAVYSQAIPSLFFAPPSANTASDAFVTLRYNARVNSGNFAAGTIPQNFQGGYAGFIEYSYLGNTVSVPSSTALETFINDLQPSMGLTQTVYPLNIRTTATGQNSKLIEWDPIAYTADGGYYTLYYGTDPNNFSNSVQISGKDSDSFELTDLDFNTEYFIAIETFTSAHAQNHNNILSPRSAVYSFRTGVPPAQREILVALYNSLGGENWQSSNNWLTQPVVAEDGLGRIGSELSWEGITYELIDGQLEITEIDLTRNTLNGRLPANLCELPHLKVLKLAGNAIVGEIPECIVNLPLETLELDYNGLYTFNDEVRNFVEGLNPGWESTQTVAPADKVVELLNPSAVVTWTPITYQAPSGRYFIKYRAEDEGGFKTITVEGKNSSEGTIPDLEYGKKYLVYVQTQADANPPFNPSAVTSDLTQVATIFFATPIAQTEREALIALYEAMGGDDWTNNEEWKDPVNFSASGTEFLWSGVTLSKVDDVWTVTGIDLSNNNLQGELPDVFGAFPNLTSLNLAGNCIEGAVPTSLANLSNLESLDLSRNRFNSFTLTSLSATNVNVSYNALGQGDDNTALLESKQADYLSTQTIAPSPLTIETDATAATISWEAIAYSAGEGYYEVRLRRTGSTSWSTRTTENKGQSSVSYNDLMGSTDYEVQIRTLSIDREEGCYTFSRWSESTTFSTLQPLPARPILSSPQDYAINTATALNLVVAATAHADSYEIQLSTSRDFNEGSTTSYSTTTGSQAIEGLNTNERYYWRARGVNTRGNGPWSQTSQFRTGLSQSVSIIEGQSTCLAEGAQTFSWNAVAGASHYRIEIATDANFSNVIRRATALQTTQLTVFDLNPNQTYFWRVQAYNDVSGFIGNWSATGQISIQPRIQITGELELCAGSSTTLSLNSTGSIQWYRNGSAIRGATGSSYTATTAGDYYAIISNAGSSNCASYQTETVAITQAAQTTPTITASSTQVCEGETTTLSTPATGTAYQWYRNGTAIAGATATSYSTAEAGTYTVEVSINNSCSSISAGITIQRIALPQDQSISVTGSTDLCGTEEGTTLSLNTDQLEGLSIQWYRDGTAIANATATSYTATEAGEYTAQISNGTCSTTTEAITLTGTVLPIPTITLTELGQTQLRLGMPVALRASTAPTGTRYLWYRDGEELEGLNSAMILATQNGDYQVAIESSTGCSTISEEYLLTWPEGREPRDQQTRAIDARDLSGIAQEIRDGWIMAFPNPTESMITISVSADKLSNSTVEVRVTDFLGRTVYSGTMQQAGDRYESSFNMGNLRRGLYYIHVEDGTVSYRKTVKKE